MARIAGPLLLLLALSVSGCGEDSTSRSGLRPIPALPAAGESPSAEEESLPLEEEQSAVEPPVDELDDAELEAACYRGRQEACDRLGH